MPASTVSLVEGDKAELRVLRSIVESGGWQVTAYETGQDFLAAYDPDNAGCIVLDVRLPEMSGLSVHSAILERGGETPVIFISHNASVATAVLAMKHGAIDFLPKPIAPEHLISQVDEALRLDTQKRQRRSSCRAFAKRLSTLTARQREVLDLVVAGKLNKQIAAELGIGERTVEIHRNLVMKKMRADTLAHLIKMVLMPSVHGSDGYTHKPKYLSTETEGRLSKIEFHTT